MSAIAVSVPQAHDSVDRLRATHTNARPCTIINDGSGHRRPEELEQSSRRPIGGSPIEALQSSW